MTTCLHCSTLNGLRISHRGQAVPCDCPAGDEHRVEMRETARQHAMLGLMPAGQSNVLPWQEAGRTVILGGTPQ